MVVLRMLVEAISVIIAALAGNWLGGEIRFRLTGKPVQTIRFQYTTTDGRTIRNIPVVTKFYPALLIGLLRKPHWLHSFLAGVATGALIDDRLEHLLWQRFETSNAGTADGHDPLSRDMESLSRPTTILGERKN